MNGQSGNRSRTGCPAVTGAAAEDRGLSENRLRQLLAGDLATIAQKCLSPRPRDRYPSIDSLITDIQRYLGGRPVLARPQTALYRFSKFIRRHRGAAAATLLAAMALLASLGYAGWRQQQALRQGQRALRMQTFMYRLFKLANSNYTGKPSATVPEFLALGVKILPEYIKDPSDLREAQMGLAESMYENGDLDGARMSFAAFALATVCVRTFCALSRSPFSYIDSARPICASRRSAGFLMYSGSIFTPSARNSGTVTAGLPV